MRLGIERVADTAKVQLNLFPGRSTEPQPEAKFKLKTGVGPRRRSRISEDERALWSVGYTPSLFAPPTGASPNRLKSYLNSAPPIVRQALMVLCDMAAARGDLDSAADGVITLYVNARKLKR